MRALPISFPAVSDDLACWIPLLHWIHQTSLASLSAGQKAFLETDVSGYPQGDIRLPAVVFRQRSWDFQPPDVAKPLAKTTLSVIAVLARRMGMKWKEFRPSDGILRAEGHSHVITSTLVRSLGIVLQYSYTGRGSRLQAAEQNVHGRRMASSILSEFPEVYIPRAGADRLGSGVIRCHPSLGLPDFTLSTQAEIVTALSFLDRSGQSSVKLSEILKSNPEFRFRVADLVAFTTGIVRVAGSDLVQIPAPSDNIRGVTTSAVGRRAFRMCLEEYIAVQDREIGYLTREALRLCKDLGSSFAAWDYVDESSADDEPWIVTRDCHYLDALQHTISDLTNILFDMEQRHPSFRYAHLLGTHIKVAMFAEGGETSLLRSLVVDYRADVNGYFKNLQKIEDEMARLGSTDRQFVMDAWVTMMLRGMCWGAMHFFVEGERVPVEFFGSQLPVYIG